MRNKNKFNIFALILYILLLFILSFLTKYISRLNYSIANLFSKDMDVVNMIEGILIYVEIVLFYGGLGIIVTIFCIDNVDTFKYILIYSILSSLVLVVLSQMIKSFFITLDYMVVIASFLSILAGVAVEIVTKIKQIKGDKDEDEK